MQILSITCIPYACAQGANHGLHTMSYTLHSYGQTVMRRFSQLPCREDAPKVFRRYWDYTLPIRKFMADTSEEAMQVTRCAGSMLPTLWMASFTSAGCMGLHCVRSQAWADRDCPHGCLR